MSAVCIGCWGWNLLLLLLLLSCSVCPLGATGRHHSSLWRTEQQNVEQEELLIRSLLAQIKGEDEEKAGRDWMVETNRQNREVKYRVNVANWNYITNITRDTEAEKMRASNGYRQWLMDKMAEANSFPFHTFSPDLQRQFAIFTLTTDPSDPEIFSQIGQLASEMMRVYNTGKVCGTDDTGQCLPLEPDLQDLMAQSQDPAMLSRLWQGWREVAGRPNRHRYQQTVDLLNLGAREQGYSDFGEAWRYAQFMGETDVEKMAADLWSELRPLYLELHAYVRRGLRQRYGNDVVGRDGTIPAHILGNMWSQSWRNIFPIVTPYPQHARSASDLNDILKSRFDVHGLFKLSEEFYYSLGLFNMTDIFWQRSMMVKPPDREVQCHASATDFYKKDDFRIKMCSEVSTEYLGTIHHEMGHVEYFMAYAQQPTVFRAGANCAVHEAIGDTISLSVMSRTHLQALGLRQQDSGGQYEQDINDLMQMALHKVAFLPFGLLVDRWRWQVFRGETPPDSYNRHWWDLRLELQGLRAPVPRSEKDFDPAAKFHVPANSAYICYFISHVSQFQYYKTLCEASGHKGPLHLCDIYDSPEAGAVFKRFLSAGASRPWKDVLEEFTGSREVTTDAILEYFQPLHQWLKEDNIRHNEIVGWEGATVNWEGDEL